MIMKLILILFILLFVSSASADVRVDNFDNDILNEKWIITKWRPFAVEEVSWSVEDGFLKGEWPNWNGQMLLLDEYPSLNFTIQVKVRIDRIVLAHEWNGAGIIFRSSGPGEEPKPNMSPFYVFAINIPIAGFATSTTMAVISGIPGRYNIDEWYTLKVVVRDDSFLGYVNNEDPCKLKDRFFKGKFVGLVVSCHTYASFDDFMISDSVDEAAFENFAVSYEGRLATAWGYIKQN